MVDRNYLIINKTAQEFSEMKMAGRTAVFVNRDGRPLDYGVIRLDDSVYTIMSCDMVQLIMMVIDKNDRRTVEGIIWKDNAEYERSVEALKQASGIRISRQDLKISGYAWSVAKKMDEGVRVKVTDAVNESDMIACPECGMLNPKGSEYCLDCGAEL